MNDRVDVKDTCLNCGQKHVMILSSLQLLMLYLSSNERKPEKIISCFCPQFKYWYVFYIFSIIQKLYCQQKNILDFVVVKTCIKFL